MLISNGMEKLPSYYAVISDQFKKAEKIDLAVSYIRQSGVSTLKELITQLGSNIRLVCSFDMDITDPLAIKELLDMGVAVRIYQAQRGTLHAKLWLFEHGQGRWNCIVGSANLSANALRENMEVGVLIKQDDNPQAINEALGVFNFIWDNDKCRDVTDEDIRIWAEGRRKRKEMKSQLKQQEKRPPSPDEDIKRLKKFARGWIDIGVNAQTIGSGLVGRLWRGWYIIPDHGYIDDELMNRLRRICKIVSSEEGAMIDISSDNMNPSFQKILDITEKKFVRAKHKMKPRALFVRQEKNYLIHLGFLFHPYKANGKLNKQLLKLTEYGRQFARARNVAGGKKIYTEAMREYSYNNLHLLQFTYELLEQLKTLNFTEFSFFANHAYSSSEVDSIVTLITIYRNLSPEARAGFQRDMDKYFRAKLEHTASGVKMNYDKSVKHTMSALGWCEGLHFDFKNNELRLAE